MSNISSADFRLATGTPVSRTAAFEGTLSQLIRCDIVFGMPSQDCRGTGICKLSSELDAPPEMKNTCRQTVAFATCAGAGDTLTLLFFRSLLCVELFSRQFRKGVFDMPEPCVLDQRLQTALGLSGATLLPGKYVISQQGDCFRVDLRCA